MTWGLTREDLEAARDALARQVAEDPHPRREEQLARAHRWLDEDEASRRLFRAAAAHAEARARERNREPRWFEYGFALRLAGDADAALAAFARAPSDEPGVQYLLGGKPAGKGFWPRTLRALANGDVSGRDEIVALVRAGRGDPSSNPSGFTLWDLLEESFRVEAERSGTPVPDHRTMLERAGLLLAAPRTPLPPAQAPPSRRWTLRQLTPRGKPVKTVYDDTGGGPILVKLGRAKVEIYTDGGSYWAQVDGVEDSALLPTFGDALEHAADLLIAYAADGEWAAGALTKLIAAGDDSVFEVDRAALEADRDAALERRPTAENLAAIARAHRWLDEHEAAARAVDAAIELERSDDERRAALLQRAGRVDEARPLLERALAQAEQRQDRRAITRLKYRLDDRVRVPWLEDGLEAAVALLADEHGSFGLLAPGFARDTLTALIRSERSVPSQSVAYDWLEETFRVAARFTGRPLPDHQTMLERSGLLRGAPIPAKGPPLPRAVGRRVIGDASLELQGVGQLIARFGDGRSLEFCRDVVWLSRDDDLVDQVDAHRSFGESLATARALVGPENFAVLETLLDGAGAAFRAEHELSRGWQLDLEAELEAAKAAGDLEHLGRACRWLDREDDARRHFLAAAARERDPLRRGLQLRNAGDVDGARREFRTVLATGPGPSLAFELRYLLGEAPTEGAGRGIRGAVMTALAARDLSRLQNANRDYLSRFKFERTPLNATAGGLAPFDLLEETVHTEHDLLGWERPSHRQILVSAYLLPRK